MRIKIDTKQLLRNRKEVLWRAFLLLKDKSHNIENCDIFLTTIDANKIEIKEDHMIFNYKELSIIINALSYNNIDHWIDEELIVVNGEENCIINFYKKQCIGLLEKIITDCGLII